MNRLRRELRDIRQGFRILASREFWRAFNAYWSSDAIRARTDEWIARARENMGLPPDPEIEARRAMRRDETGPDASRGGERGE